MKPISWILVSLIRAYQLAISPFTPAHCRYLPTCSAYASEAIARHGPVNGGWLALRRLVRCHPWGGFGFDPVPDPPDRAPALGFRMVSAAAGSTLRRCGKHRPAIGLGR